MTRLLFALVGLILAGGIFIFYTRPAYDNVQASQVEIVGYNAALDKARELQQLKQTLLSRFNAFDPANLDRLQKLLPDHVDNVRLILDLDNLANRYGLSLQNVDISSSAAQDKKSQTAIGAIGASSQKYDSLTLTFSTRGTYANFYQFLSDLESSLRIVDLASLSLTPESRSPVAAPAGKKGEPVQTPEPIYAYNITLRTYWLK
ncbi:MAG: hypothetical protein RLZZ416_272 [Candidatus Parcubacteria bacterium]|jgi:Tfp pilus assembly protein PilO